MKMKYACLAGALLAFASPSVAEPWVDYEPTKGFWTVTTIKVDSNKIDDYLTGLKEGWVPGVELARRNGLIDDYKIMVNTANAAAVSNVILMTHIPNGAALDPDKARDVRMRKEGFDLVAKKRGDELVAGYNTLRTFVDDGLWQEFKFRK
jgi:hypothetical protein